MSAIGAMQTYLSDPNGPSKREEVRISAFRLAAHPIKSSALSVPNSAWLDTREWRLTNLRVETCLCHVCLSKLLSLVS